MTLDRAGAGATPSRTAQLQSTLRRAILDGALAPGQRINLDDLRRVHDVSLSPLREALSRLVAENLVQFRDRRGFFVAPISAAHLAETTRLRSDQEALALSHAIAAGDLDWESGVLAALHRLRRAPDDGLSEDDMAFHAALAAGAGMPMLQDICSRLVNLHLRYVRVLAYPGNRRDAFAEHRAIAEAAIARDAELAPTLLKRHIERTGADLAAMLPAAEPPR
ncbi:MAG: transcriptional regulator [Rhodobacteraceae bacterium HLUCCA08]|nr:MAG: transcriptional regulator [Rhodobacteraceae bacterium HLUCCA08]